MELSFSSCFLLSEDDPLLVMETRIKVKTKLVWCYVLHTSSKVPPVRSIKTKKKYNFFQDLRLCYSDADDSTRHKPLCDTDFRS